jgi:hypothetical protein
MKVIFFDSNATLLAKNFLITANYLCDKCEDFSALYISAEIASVSEEIENESISKIRANKNFEFQTLKSFNQNTIRAFLIKIQPDFFFIDCYRLIDQLWVGIANDLGIKTYMIQHGFEINSVNYQPFTILTKFHKGIRLAIASYNLARFLNVNPLVLFSQYFRYIYFSKLLIDTHLGNKKLHPIRAFVYSKYYISFYNKKFGFLEEITTLISYPDLYLIPQINAKTRSKGICYISQTLVEDGRMKKNHFFRLMEEYKLLATQVDEFIIKLHPRGNKDLYSDISKIGNVKLVHEFPHCSTYLTHYSSMAFVAAFITNNIIIHELRGHTTPDVFRAVSSHVVKSSSEILSLLESESFTDSAYKEANVNHLNEVVNYNKDIYNNDIILKCMINDLA